MEKVTFTSEEGDSLEFYVLEQTTVSGREYLLVSEDEDGDGEAYILRRVGDFTDTDAEYAFVEEETELSVIGKVFAELMDEETELQVN